MDKERFVKMLGDLCELQASATLNGVNSFEIQTHYWKSDPDCGDEPDEFAITGYVYLRGDDSEGDYLRYGFYESQEPADWFRTFNNLKAFVSCL